MAYTLNRRLAQLVDSNGQLNTGKIPNDYITGDHIADNVITSAMLHTSFTVSTSNLTAIDTDDVSEGSTNLYYTTARWDTKMAAADTDDLSEGLSNLYFTNERVDDRVNALLSAGTGITLTYDDANNTLTIAGAAQYGDSDVESYLSGGTGVTFSSGVISIGQDVSTSATPTFGNTITGTLQATSFSDGTISGITFIDEDSFATNSATRVPTQQSIKAYVDAQVAGVVDSAPAALNTLNELAAALGDDANFSTTTSTALGNRLRVDTAAQGLTGTQQANAITNLGVTATKAELNTLDGITATVTELNYTDGVTSNIQTQLDTKLASSSYTAADVLTKIKTVDGAGSGLDADLLDGLSSASFLRADATDTATGNYSFEGTANYFSKSGSTGWLTLGSITNTSSNGYVRESIIFSRNKDQITYDETNSNWVHAGGSSTDWSMITHTSGSMNFYAGDAVASSTTYSNANFNTNYLALSINNSSQLVTFYNTPSVDGNDIWHAGNDGSGSGLDADLLDGVQGASFLRSDATDTASGNLTFTGTNSYGSTSSYKSFIYGGLAFTDYANSALTNGRIYFQNDNFYVRGGGEGTADTTTNTTLQVRHSGGWGEVWHTRNDGSGSGLDADTLDTLQASQFLRSDASDTMSGNLIVAGTITSDQGSGGGSYLKINTADAVYARLENTYSSNDVLELCSMGSIQFSIDTNNNSTGKDFIWKHNGQGASGTTLATLYGDSGDLQITGDLYVPDQIIHNGDSNTYMQFNAADTWRVVAGGSQKLVVNTSGVFVSNGVLDLNDNSLNDVGTINMTNNGNINVWTSSSDTGTGSVNLPRGGHITFYGNSNVDHSIGSRNAAGDITDDLRFSSYGAMYFDLDANNNNTSTADFVIGRHGSGTGTLSELFRISGEDALTTVVCSTNYRGIHVRGSNAPVISFGKGAYEASSAEWKVGISGNNGANFSISSGTGATDKFVITSAGATQLGEMLYSSNDNHVHWFGNTTTWGTRPAIGRAAGTNFHMVGSAAGDLIIGAEANKYIYFGTNTTTGNPLNRMRIEPNGIVRIQSAFSNQTVATHRDVWAEDTGELGYNSSVRASKMNIEDVTDASWLYNVNPKTFYKRLMDEEGNYLEENTGIKEYGFIAEDIEEYAPELCFYDIEREVDEDGNIVEGGTITQTDLAGINYSHLTSPMLKLIQQQKQLIDDLTARIEALEG